MNPGENAEMYQQINSSRVIQTGGRRFYEIFPRSGTAGRSERGRTRGVNRPELNRPALRQTRFPLRPTQIPVIPFCFETAADMDGNFH